MSLRFRGSFEHTIDEKGRASLPARFRETIFNQGDRMLVLTYGGDHLDAYSSQKWQKLEDEYLKLPKHNARVNRYLRTLMAHVYDCDIDKQGRVLIPPQLRRLVNLNREIVIVGIFDKIEIWDKQVFEMAQTKGFENFEDDLAEINRLLSGKGDE
ncbi:MAG: division/cell wall cluster transcriptional repressor MraZ [Deltaproteobacteria bacterium]|nr:MAG: division/cell wall cluster transcriptional repressor MraZ [Deltaproteobacteria bacterium]